MTEWIIYATNIRWLNYQARKEARRLDVNNAAVVELFTAICQNILHPSYDAKDSMHLISMRIFSTWSFHHKYHYYYPNYRGTILIQ